VLWPDRSGRSAGSADGAAAFMTNQLFEAALGFKSPWFVQAVAFDASQRRLTVGIDFAPGSRFAHPNTPGSTPVARLALEDSKEPVFMSNKGPFFIASL